MFSTWIDWWPGLCNVRHFTSLEHVCTLYQHTAQQCTKLGLLETVGLVMPRAAPFLWFACLVFGIKLLFLFFVLVSPLSLSTTREAVCEKGGKGARHSL